MSRDDKNWLYGFDDNSQNNKGPRTGVESPDCFKLIGVDGNSNGGLSPFKGFQLATKHYMPNLPLGDGTVQDFYETADPEGSEGLATSADDDIVSSRWKWNIRDIHPFSVRYGFGWAYGYVYRASKQNNRDTTATNLCELCVLMYTGPESRSGTQSSVKRLHFRLCQVAGPKEFTDTWQRNSPGVSVLGGARGGGADMSVTTQGRYFYIGVEGMPMIQIGIRREGDYSSPNLDDLMVKGGKLINGSFFAGNYGNNILSPGSLETMGPGKRPKFFGLDKWSYLGATTPLSGTRVGSEEVGYGGVWASQYTIGGTISNYGTISGGGTAFAKQARVNTSVNEKDPGQADDELQQLEPGDYAFAYQLQNSETGLRSALSDVAWLRLRDFIPDGRPGMPAGDDNLTVGTTGEQETFLDAIPLFAYWEILMDSDRYDQVLLYRSVRTQDGGGAQGAGILHLEKIIEVPRHTITGGDSGTYVTPNLGGASWQTAARITYGVSLDDKALVYQPTYLDGSIVDEEVPRAGAVAIHEGTMFCSNSREEHRTSSSRYRKEDFNGTGQGEIRYSTLIENNAEHFPAENRYSPKTEGSVVIKWANVGDVLMGFSQDKLYMLRKEGTYLGKPIEMHTGYGIINPHAVAVVGDSAYYCSVHGVKMVRSNGQLGDVSALNYIIQNDWKEEIHWISMAYDGPTNAVYLLNGKRHECYIMWLNTNRVTQLKYAPFRMCSTASWPINWFWDENPSQNRIREWENPLAPRAFFVEDKVYEKPIAVEKGVGDFRRDYSSYPEARELRIFMPRTRNQVVHSRGDVAGTVIANMCQGDGVSRVTLAEDWATTQVNYPGCIKVVASGTSIITNSRSFYVHVLSSVGADGQETTGDQSLVGVSARLVLDAPDLDLLRASGLSSGEFQTGFEDITADFTGAGSSSGGPGSPGDNELYLQLDPVGIAALNGLRAGSRLCIAPIFFEVQTAPLRVELREGASSQNWWDQNWFSQRVASGVGCVFANVSGRASTDGAGDNRFSGLLFQGNDPEELTKGLAKKHDGTYPGNVINGVSQHYSNFGQRFGTREAVLTPGVRVVCSDLDFTMLGFQVKGHSDETSRGKRGSA